MRRRRIGSLIAVLTAALLTNSCGLTHGLGALTIRDDAADPVSVTISPFLVGPTFTTTIRCGQSADFRPGIYPPLIGTPWNVHLASGGATYDLSYSKEDNGTTVLVRPPGAPEHFGYYSEPGWPWHDDPIPSEAPAC